MSIREQMGEDLKQAMRDRDQLRMDTIRSVRSAVTNREVESGKDLDDDGVLAVIRSLVKQRVDAAQQYEAGGRTDLADTERKEQSILEAYLPAAPDEATVERVVREVIQAVGAQGMKDMGRVMKESRAKLGPAADGKLVSGVVKRLLA